MVTESTVRKHLPPRVRANLTIALLDPMAHTLTFSTLAGWLAGAFDWSRSPQGLVYWTRVCYLLNLIDIKHRAEHDARLLTAKPYNTFNLETGVTRNA